MFLRGRGLAKAVHFLINRPACPVTTQREPDGFAVKNKKEPQQCIEVRLLPHYTTVVKQQLEANTAQAMEGPERVNSDVHFHMPS